MYVNVPVFQISLHCDDSNLIKNPNKNGTFPQNFSLGRCSSLDMRDVSLGGRPVGLAKIHHMQQLQQHLTSLSLTFTFSMCDTIYVWKSCSSYHTITDIIWLFCYTIKACFLPYIFTYIACYTCIFWIDSVKRKWNWDTKTELNHFAVKFQWKDINQFTVTIPGHGISLELKIIVIHLIQSYKMGRTVAEF